MKKLSVIVFTMILMLSLFGCGKKDVSENTTVAETNTTKSQLHNAGKSVKKSEFDAVVGETVKIPENADNENYYVIEQESKEFGQATFKRDGIDYVLRIKDSNEFSDISGMYFTWTATTECEVNGNKAEIHLYNSEDDSCSVIIWYNTTNKKMYSISTDGVVTEDSLIKLATEI